MNGDEEEDDDDDENKKVKDDNEEDEKDNKEDDNENICVKWPRENTPTPLWVAHSPKGTFIYYLNNFWGFLAPPPVNKYKVLIAGMQVQFLFFCSFCMFCSFCVFACNKQRKLVDIK